MKRLSNHSELLETLRRINLTIQQAVSLRSGAGISSALASRLRQKVKERDGQGMEQLIENGA